MKISSNNYYDYYYTQMYQSNSVSNTNSINEESDSSKSETTSAVSLTKKRPSMFNENVSMEDLNQNGRTMMNSLKMQDEDYSEESQEMKTLSSDMDSLKTVDIDNMSSDDIKSLFAKLKTDIEAVKNPYVTKKSSSTASSDSTNSSTATTTSTSNTTSDTSSTTTESISEADIRSILKKVQENLNSRPPMPPVEDTNSTSTFNKVKQDMDSIKALDVDNMSTDEVKKVITNLKSDMDAIASPYSKKSKTSTINLDSMSESDMKTMLKKIQERVNNESTETQKSA